MNYDQQTFKDYFVHNETTLNVISQTVHPFLWIPSFDSFIEGFSVAVNHPAWNSFNGRCQTADCKGIAMAEIVTKYITFEKTRTCKRLLAGKWISILANYSMVLLLFPFPMMIQTIWDLLSKRCNNLLYLNSRNLVSGCIIRKCFTYSRFLVLSFFLTHLLRWFLVILMSSSIRTAPAVVTNLTPACDDLPIEVLWLVTSATCLFYSMTLYLLTIHAWDTSSNNDVVFPIHLICNEVVAASRKAIAVIHEKLLPWFGNIIIYSPTYWSCYFALSRSIEERPVTNKYTTPFLFLWISKEMKRKVQFSNRI